MNVNSDKEYREAAELSWENSPPGEPIPDKTYRADGWFYLDIPGKFSYELWEKYLSWIGEGEYVVLAISKGKDLEGSWIRGQLIVSLKGMKNLALG